jgi:hypothetical protein
MVASAACLVVGTVTCCGTASAALPYGLRSGHLPLHAIQMIELPGPDYGAIAAQDARRSEQGLPLLFAEPHAVAVDPAHEGTWEWLPEGDLLWRLRVFSEGSAHLNFGFTHFELPRTASVHMYSLDGSDVLGPLTMDDANADGGIWTRVIQGGEVVIEATLAPSDRAAFESGVLLSSINVGYRGFASGSSRGSSESCNIDVACSEGDAWRDEIASVGVYTVEGYWTCSGFMVNNTAGDQRPLFLTANHCGIGTSNDQTVVVYWNHENSFCRTPGSGDSGGSGDGSYSQYTSGATYLAGNSYYDTTIVDLAASPDAEWGVTFAGWSRATTASNGAGIHHPECAEKRISFPDTTTADGRYWRVNWNTGRTAPGSSGSPLFGGDHRAIGQLCCGNSYCWNDDDDYYGRGFAGAWSALSAYLDPLNTDPTGIDTLVPGGSGAAKGACCFAETCTYVTEQECQSIGGTYLGDFVSCAGNPCDPFNGDTCNAAQLAVVGANAFETTTATDSGFGAPDESQCSNTFLDWDDSPDRWFKWQSPGDGTIDLDTCDPSSYDTSMVLYQGDSCDNLTQIACNGDGPDDVSCQEYYSQIPGIAVTSAQTYWIRLGGWKAATGTGTLNLTYSGTSDPTGGCCLGISCEVRTAADCALNGGMYLGDGTDCLGNPCGEPIVGACCLGGECTVSTESDCLLTGGNYLGDDSDCTDNPCDTGGGAYLDIRWKVIGTNLLSTGEACYTFDVFADIPEDWRLDAVAGNSLQQKTISSTTSFYQSSYGGPTSTDINPDLFPLVPDLQWDSRVTIGCLDSSGTPYEENALNDIGIDWTTFESGGDLSANDGTWFCLPTDLQGETAPFTDNMCENRTGVFIARLTTMDHAAEVLVEALFQGRDDDNIVWQDTASAFISYQGEQDCNGNLNPDACDIASGDSDDDNGNGIPDECESGCQWDLNGDGTTDVNDLLELIGGFGSQYDVDELLALLAEFGCGG